MEPIGVRDLVLLGAIGPGLNMGLMARPANKVNLVKAANEEFERLWAVVDAVPRSARESPGACEDWSVKNLLSHLHAWQEMALRWESKGAAGEQQAIPAEGFTFAEIPALNEAIFERTKDDQWDDVVAELKTTHQELLRVIDGYDDEDLFTKKKYPWTKSTSVGSYMVSATSSHYAWASKLIGKYVKSLPTEPSAAES